jgi:alanyl-tRNA synthetase
MQRNHTATHLLHWALHEVLDKGATQKGSEVSPNRLRFDFAWKAQVAPEELKEIERLVNEKIARNDEVATEEMPIAQARSRGAIAMFGEKYGDLVRVVDVDGYSVEFCGGTHVGRTGDIGMFKLVEESSISKGVRRVSALTGDAAVTKGYADTLLLSQIAQQLKVPAAEAVARIGKLMADIKELERRNKEAMQAALPSWEELKAQAEDKNGTKVLAVEVQGADADALRRFADGVKRQSEPFVGFFLAKDDKGKVPLVVALSQPLVDQGWHARDLLRPVAGVLGGGGGGKRADMCQGSGKDPSKIADALAEAHKQVAGKLG